MRPDVVIILTDEERAAPPYEGDDAAALAPRHADRPALVRRARRLASAATTPARWPACPAGRRCSPGSTPTSTASPRPTGSARWPTTRGCAGCREGEVPTLGHWFRAARLRHPLRRQVAHQPRRPDRPGDRRAARHQRRRRRGRPGRRAGVPRRRPARPVRVLGLGRARAARRRRWPTAAPRRDPLIADRVVAWLEDRYARRRAGDADGAPPVPARGQLREPARHRAVPGVGPAGQPDRAVAARPAAGAGRADRRRGPAHEAGRPGRLPGRLPHGLRPGAGDRPHLRARRAALPRPLLPAARRGRRTARPGAPGRHRGRLDRRRAGAHLRPRRAARRPRRPAPEVVQPLRRGHPGAVHGRPHRRPADHRRDGRRACRPRTSTSCPRCWPRRASTRPPSPTSCAARSPRCTRCPGRDLLPRGRRAGERPTGAGPVYLRPATTCSRATPGRRAWPAGSAAPSTRRCRCASRCRPTSAPASRASCRSTTRASAGRPPLEARAHLRRPGHLDRARACATSPPTARPACSSAPSRSPDQWELYDLTEDPIEVRNRADDGSAPDVLAQLAAPARRAAPDRAVPERNQPWPYVARTRGRPDRSGPRPRPAWSAGSSSGSACTPRTPQPVGLRPAPAGGRWSSRTNHGTLDIGKPTGVFASELTVPYYAFLDAGMDVDVASPLGGVIPVDPLSLKPVVRTEADDRFLADDDLRAKVTDSLAVGDRSTSAPTTSCTWPAVGARRSTSGSPSRSPRQVTEANAAGKVIGGICHGPLGLRNATGARRSAAGRGPADHRGHRQAGAASSASSPRRTTPRPSCGRKGALFESATAVPGPARQPLGGRRQPRDRPEPERRADGRPGDAAARRGAGGGPAGARPCLRSRRPATARSTRTTPPSWPPRRPTRTGRCG